MPDNIQKGLSGESPVPQEEIKQNLEEGIEKDYAVALSKVQRKNIKKLVQLDFLEKERIARHIKDLYEEVKSTHQKRCDAINKYDRVYRMQPGATIDVDGDTPNYCTDLSTVTLEVVHANIMNVFFTPAKLMRVLPTEEGDISKVNKLDIFGNWSMANEMNIFENCDRLFHSSEKNGECPYIVHWVKEYGEEVVVEVIPNPQNPSEPMLDDEGDIMTQEREVVKKLYDGPRLEVFSKKDYILPLNATADKKPDWEMRILRLGADKVRRREDEGKYYPDTFKNIGGWGVAEADAEDNTTTDKESKSVPVGKTEKLFLEFYGTLRVNQIIQDKESEEDSFEELEDEFIGLIELHSETLCYLKKNRFPMKERPIGLDVFIPDDEGRAEGIGVIEFMEGIQLAYDIFYNQYVFGVTQSNNPIGFFTPTGNMKDEPIHIKAGFMFPTSDPNSVKMVEFPAPNQSLILIMEETRNQAQLLFGISDYAAGIESKIDPSAPAKKAEIVVAQGNTRLNLIIRRKNKTLKDIFRRWFLLYKENMPKNKFMRIAGGSKDSPWKFESIRIGDFALNALPDFELTGNILNSNKALEAQKAVGIYNALLNNPFFSPQTQSGLQALHSLTKWFIDKMDDIGLSHFLPEVPGDKVFTPEEENARFIQGDTIDPVLGEDQVQHIRVHTPMLYDTSLSPEIIKEVKRHLQETIGMLKQKVTFQLATGQQGGMNGPNQGAEAVNRTGGSPQPTGMGTGAGNPGENLQ